MNQLPPLATEQSQGRPKYGLITPIDTGITQILTLIATEPAYQEMRVGRVLEIIDAIKKGYYLAAVESGLCTAAVLYVRVSEEAARVCIKDARMPTVSEVSSSGAAICMTGVVGRQTSALTRKFFTMFRGNLVIYERHFKSGASLQHCDISWVDRSGKLKGKDI